MASGFSGGTGGLSLNLATDRGEFCALFCVELWAELCADIGFLGKGGGCLPGGGKLKPSGRLFKLWRLGGISGGGALSAKRAGIAGTGLLCCGGKGGGCEPWGFGGSCMGGLL